MNPDINYIIQQSIKGDKYAQEKLLEKLKPLILKNINKYCLKDDVLYEDLVQEGYIVILNSLKTYNPDKKVHFLGYVKFNIKYFYINYFRNKSKNIVLSLSKMSSDVSDKTDCLENLIKVEDIKELQNCMKNLAIKDQNILNMYYKEDFSMSEISNILKMPYRTVIGRKYNAIKKIRKMMEHNFGGD